jgi:hypothetical protein
MKRRVLCMTEKLGWRGTIWTGHISLTVLRADWNEIWEVIWKVNDMYQVPFLTSRIKGIEHEDKMRTAITCTCICNVLVHSPKLETCSLSTYNNALDMHRAHEVRTKCVLICLRNRA